ncbi:MAG: hypothetical protein LBM21_01955, partial [Coriobacteriales bacterium]|nr:hypothetical protein [Coriobacteriales bacterium]
GLESAYSATVGTLPSGSGTYSTIAPLADYLLPGLGDSPISTVAAGFIGAIVVAAVVWAVATVLVRHRKTANGAN